VCVVKRGGEEGALPPKQASWFLPDFLCTCDEGTLNCHRLIYESIVAWGHLRMSRVMRLEACFLLWHAA